MRTLGRLGIVVSLAAIFQGCSVLALPFSVAHARRFYHGEVSDVETGEPIEGAVVVVVWHSFSPFNMERYQHYQRAVETLTDAKGKFSIRDWPGVNLNPFTVIDSKPWIIVFKPGYGAYPWRSLSPPLHGDPEQRFLEGNIVALPKLKSREELIRFKDLVDLGWINGNWPRDDIPNLMRLLNEQRQRLELPLYPTSTK